MNGHHETLAVFVASDVRLPATGERFVQEFGGDMALEHLHRYFFACELAPGKVVLDIASGEGYGSWLLAKTAKRVVGVDVSGEAIAHASEKYLAGNLEFMVGSCSQIPLPDGSVDLVVSFETIEHHDQHSEMMAEIRRVLRSDGLLIISCPDKKEYSDVPGYVNPYHVKELYRDEFADLLEGSFANVDFFGQRVLYGSSLLREDGSGPHSSYIWSGDTAIKTIGVWRPRYLMALATNSKLPIIGGGVFEQPIAQSELARGLADSNRQLSDVSSELREVGAERDALRNELQQVAVQREGLRSELHQIAAEREALRAALSAIQVSTSWRLTKPVRWVGHRIKDIQNLALLAASIVRYKDGLTAAIRTTVRVLRREGLSGVRHRVSYFARHHSSMHDRKTALNAAQSRGADMHAMDSRIANQVENGNPVRIDPNTRLGSDTPSHRALSALPRPAPANDPGLLRDTTKLIAFYLPQFHEIKENSQWWGPGFTEWTNVAKARPNFEGHYQPHIPRDLGFYDLHNVNVMRAQAQMAGRFGLHAFCFYYYWFSGRRILERPLDAWLASGIDFPFCLCWANENWTRTWAGDNEHVLLRQDHAEGDEERFISDVLPFLQDPRYLRVGGKPMLLVYRIKQLPDPAGSISKWRTAALQAGLPGLHIAVVDFYDINDPQEVGADALVEFPPHKFNGPENQPDFMPVITNPQFTGGIVTYKKMVQQSIQRPAPAFTLYRGIIPGWDNTPRRQNSGFVVIDNSPYRFGQWLRYLRSYSRCVAASGGDSFIFLNAWNEWGEGCHLEPDLQNGTRYLEEVLKSSYYDGLLAPKDLAQAQQRGLAELSENEV